MTEHHTSTPFSGRFEPSTESSSRQALERDVRVLAVEIGERNLRDEQRHAALVQAGDFLLDELTTTGRQPLRQPFLAGGMQTSNVELEIPGSHCADEIVVIGAHYDTAHGSPGANDNATGVAATLELARLFSRANDRGHQPARTLRFVLFSCEEPPFTRSREMGSMVYAARCRDRAERIVAMLSLETLGSFYDGHRGPNAPFPLNVFSPWRGDFVAIVGNLTSRHLVRGVATDFQANAGVRSLAFAAPGLLPGVRSSDHWSFWKHHYPAVMITDTAPFRYRQYHRPTDRPEVVDFLRLANITQALAEVARTLASESISTPDSSRRRSPTS